MEISEIITKETSIPRISGSVFKMNCFLNSATEQIFHEDFLDKSYKSIAKAIFKKTIEMCTV